jgi:septal ring factor EnvC (AmiA/AmiB activator)
MIKWKIKYILIILCLLSPILAVTGFAETEEELKSKIDDRNNQIKQLEEDIKQYNIEVTNAVNEGQTLQSTLKTLDLTKKKITTDITLTEKKIDKTNLTIEQIGLGIDKTQNNIDTNKRQ